MKINFKKIGDCLLKVFGVIFGIALCSLALKVGLGLIWIFGGLYIQMGNFSTTKQTIISVIFGICLYVWWTNYGKRKNRSALDKYRDENCYKFTREEVEKLLNEFFKR